MKDIEVGPKGSAPGTFLIHYRALFAATTTAAGRELWVSDLSAGGASLWTDLRPGAAGSEPTDLVATSFYDFHFIADDGLAGREIWQSTVNGAFLSRRTDVVAGSGSVQPRELVLCSSNGNLVFTDGTDTPQLWATDGSVAGASVIGSFQVGPADLTKNASGLGPAAVVFAAEDATTGLEPWRTNGTALGTARIADIAPQGIGTPYPDIEPHGGPLGSTIQICIRNGAPTGLGVFAFASMPAPPVSIPGLVDGPILLPLGSLLLITAALLDPAGSACMPIALPLTLTTIEFSTQAFSLDPASQLFRATDLAAIGITTTSTSSIFGGPSQCSGVFRDLDHRYEVDLTLPTPTTGSHPTGSFVFRHRTCTDLIEACLTDLKEHVYPYDGKATHLVFKGNTPLGKLKGLELWFYDDAGGKTFVWKSYC